MKYSKIIMVIASLMLVTLFFFPLWRISLLAPQYPEGLTIFLWINNITDGPVGGDLKNINIMNHYVGMPQISIDSFKEFKYFPYVISGLIFTGLIAAFSGKRKLILSWVIIASIAGMLGMYDFYLWEYEYGHSLDPNAAIKIPGMAYQPPLFGRKEILNFIAYSYPALGGWSIGASIFTAAVAWVVAGKEKT